MNAVYFILNNLINIVNIVFESLHAGVHNILTQIIKYLIMKASGLYLIFYFHIIDV